MGDVDAGERAFLIADLRGYTRFTQEQGNAAAARLASAACELANRNLTRAEWKKYLGSRSYKTTCPA